MSASVRALFTNRSSASAERCSSVAPLVNYDLTTLQSPLHPPLKPRYRVDLAGQQAQCEINYYLLLKVLVNFAKRDHWVFEFGGDQQQWQLVVSVTDRAPYTTTLQLTQTSAAVVVNPVVVNPVVANPVATKSAAIVDLNITACLYHDVCMAEVVAWNSHKRLHSRYEYPNKNMYHNDEKAQHNQFLGDWLALCAAQGRSPFDMTAIVKR